MLINPSAEFRIVACTEYDCVGRLCSVTKVTTECTVLACRTSGARIAYTLQ